MQISLIMPVLNESGHIVHALRALAPLRAQGVQVIVVDGGSNDGTARHAVALADRVMHAARGRAAQMNAGAAAAGGDILLFLHADTLLPASAIDDMLDGLAATGRAWGRFDVRISGRSRLFAPIAMLMNLRSRWTGIATGDQAIFVKHDAFRAVGGFPFQPLMEDIELSRRLKRMSPPLCLRTRVTTSGRRWESRGVARTVLLMWSLRLRYWLGTSADVLARAYR